MQRQQGDDQDVQYKSKKKQQGPGNTVHDQKNKMATMLPEMIKNESK